MLNEANITAEIMSDVQQLYRPVSLLPALPRYLPEQEYDCDEYVWWEEQRRRFEKGWVAPDGKFINGIYYLYLNFLKINIGDEDKGEKVVANPLYFEEDNDLLDLVWFGIGRGIKKPAKKIVVTKGRRQHFSENMHSAVLIWFLLVKTGRPIAITYPDELYKLKTKKKFDFTLANAPDELFYKFYQGRHFVTKRSKLVRISRREIMQPSSTDVVGVSMLINGISQTVCQIEFVEVAKKKSPLSGEGYDLIIVDESGKYDQLHSLLGYGEETVAEGENRFGLIIVGGTTDNITNQSKDFIDILVNHKKLGYQLFFLEAWRMRPGHFDSKTGKSNQATGEKFVLEKWDKAAKISETEHIKAKQENPLKLEDALGVANMSKYPTEKIEEIYMYILANKLHEAPFITRGQFKRQVGLDGRKTWDVEWEENGLSGNWIRLANIAPNTTYDDLDFMCIDDFYVENPSRIDKRTSRGAIIVWRRFSLNHEESDYPIAMYYGREARTVFHEQALCAAIFFGLGNRSVAVEYNDAVLSNYFQLNGYSNMIFWQNGVAGITIKSSELGQANTLAQKWFEDDGHKRVYFLKFWDSLATKAKDNADIRSAFYVVMFMREKQISPKLKGKAVVYAPYTQTQVNAITPQIFNNHVVIRN